MKLAANLSWLYTEFDFLERVQACADDGFEFAECMFPYQYSAIQLRQAADRAGIQWILINAPAGDWEQGDRGLSADPRRRDEFRRSVEHAARFALTLGAGKVHVLAGRVNSDQADAFDRAWACYTENLEWLANEMRQEPIDWLIEPINPHDMPGYLLSRQSDAHRLISDLSKPNLGIQMDLYHCQRVEGRAIEMLAELLPTGRVKHLQVAGLPNRNEPGRGEAAGGNVADGGLDYSRVWERLRAINYQGHIGCEYRPRAATRDGLGWIRSTGFSGTMESFES